MGLVTSNLVHGLEITGILQKCKKMVIVCSKKSQILTDNLTSETDRRWISLTSDPKKVKLPWSFLKMTNDYLTTIIIMIKFGQKTYHQRTYSYRCDYYKNLNQKLGTSLYTLFCVRTFFEIWSCNSRIKLISSIRCV